MNFDQTGVIRSVRDLKAVSGGYEMIISKLVTKWFQL